MTFRVFDCTSDDPEQRAAAVDEAGAAIERGECIVLPTDTVYGIGADALDASAVSGCWTPRDVDARCHRRCSSATRR